jgi:hypothetical protein
MRVHSITSEKEEFEIISSSNCLGYIKFDFLCDLKSLVNELYEKSDLPSFNHCLLHAIGKYDSKRQYLVHRIYICSDLKSPLGLHDHDKIGGCTNANNVSQSPSRFFLSNRVTPKKGSVAGSRFAAYKSLCVPTSRQALLDAIGASRVLLAAKKGRMMRTSPSRI